MEYAESPVDWVPRSASVGLPWRYAQVALIGSEHIYDGNLQYLVSNWCNSYVVHHGCATHLCYRWY